jgi:hypothetical protein
MNEKLQETDQPTITLAQLVASLQTFPNGTVSWRLPNGQAIAPHYHLTEVARVQKDFVDCGGVRRHQVSCVLQLWVATDTQHRLESTKYLRILQSAMALFESTAIPVEVEYEDQVLSQYRLSSIECRGGQMEIRLASKHTGCLAPDRCGVPLVVLGECSGPGCCE